MTLSSEPVSFAPRIGGTFLGIVAVALGITAAAIAAAAIDEPSQAWWITLVALGPLALVLWAIFPIRYTFREHDFEAKQGVLHTIRAPYARMRSVRRKRQLTNSPDAIGMAADMLEITYEAGTTSTWTKHLRIAPKDEAGFLAELMRRAPHIETEGLGDLLAEAAVLPAPAPPPVDVPEVDDIASVPAPPPFTRAASVHQQAPRTEE